MTKFVLRIKTDARFGDFSGAYMIDSTKIDESGLVDLSPRLFDSYDEAQEFLGGLYMNQNWHVVEFKEE
jgi:hypothetical protein